MTFSFKYFDYIHCITLLLHFQVFFQLVPLYLHVIYLCVYIFHEENMIFVWVCIISLNMTISIFINFTTNDTVSLFSEDEWNSIVHLYIVYSFDDQHLGWFYNLYSAIVSMVVQILCNMLTYFPLDILPRTMCLEHVPLLGLGICLKLRNCYKKI